MGFPLSPATRLATVRPYPTQREVFLSGTAIIHWNLVRTVTLTHLVIVFLELPHLAHALTDVYA